MVEYDVFNVNVKEIVEVFLWNVCCFEVVLKIVSVW